MASKIVRLEVLDENTLNNMLAFIDALVRNKYKNHKLDTTIGFAIQTKDGPQKIEFQAHRTDFKEIEDGSPTDVPAVEGATTTTAGNEQTPAPLDRTTSKEVISNSTGAEQSSNSDADPGDAQPDTNSGS